MNANLIIFFALVIFAGALILAVIALMTTKKCCHFNVEQYRVKFLSIKQQLKKDEQSSYQLAVLNADKLLDQAMIECGMPGQNMGERLKRSGTKFSNVQQVWTAHKLRNNIAHQTDVRVTYDEARYAISYIERALKDLGAI